MGGPSIQPKGRPRSQEEKIKIGKTVSTKWKASSDERKELHSKRAKDNWEKLTAEEKADFRSKSAKAVRATRSYGSKLERYILGKLRKDGWKIHFHTNHFLPTGKLEMDIFVEDIKTLVEIDGISHYEPIHGQDSLDRAKYNDNLKNAMATQNGYNVIRVRCTPKKVTLTFCLETYNKLATILNTLKENPFLPIEKRLIHVN